MKTPSEEIYSKSTTCDLGLVITVTILLTLCDILLRIEVAIFSHCIVIVIVDRSNSNISVIYTSLKSTFSVLEFLSLAIRVNLHFLFGRWLTYLMPPKSAKSRKIPRKFKLIAGQHHFISFKFLRRTYSSSRSSKVIQPCSANRKPEGAYVTSYLSLIITLDYLVPFSRYRRIKREIACFTHNILVWRTYSWDQLQFLD